jgi:hypothetical protein
MKTRQLLFLKQVDWSHLIVKVYEKSPNTFCSVTGPTLSEIKDKPAPTLLLVHVQKSKKELLQY